MILIHGECGSGKSSALRALEAAPPMGFRAVYVPVPSLDFAGIARWCLDRLALESPHEPVTALREAAKRLRVVLLIDDAAQLPLDTALAVRHLEREGAGNLAVVAACGNDAAASASITALGPPARAILVAVGKSEEAAAAARDELAPPARTPARARAAVPAPPLRATLPRPSAAPVPVVESPRAIPTPVTQPAPAPRSVPLSLALAMAGVAFLVPVAFGAGYWIGGKQPVEQPVARAVEAAEQPALPPVASAPAEVAARNPQQLAARVPARAAALAGSEPRKAVGAMSPPDTARRSTPRAALPQAAARAPAPAAARVEASLPRVPRASAAPTNAGRGTPGPSPSAREDAAWGAPALISVEPGSGDR